MPRRIDIPEDHTTSLSRYLWCVRPGSSGAQHQDNVVVACPMAHKRYAYPQGPGPWCGTYGGYCNHGCRCTECLRAHREAKRLYRAKYPEQAEKARQRRKLRWQQLRK